LISATRSSSACESIRSRSNICQSSPLGGLQRSSVWMPSSLEAAIAARIRSPHSTFGLSRTDLSHDRSELASIALGGIDVSGASAAMACPALSVKSSESGETSASLGGATERLSPGPDSLERPWRTSLGGKSPCALSVFLMPLTKPGLQPTPRMISIVRSLARSIRRTFDAFDSGLSMRRFYHAQMA